MIKDLIIRDLPEDLRKDFKTACSHYGLTMKETLIRHMQNIVNDYRKDRFMIQKPKTYIKKKGKK